MRFGILGVAGSNSVSLLLANLPELRNCRSGTVRAQDIDMVINYGLKGQRLIDWYRGNQRRAAFESLPQINGAPAINKYEAIQLAASHNVPTPETWRTIEYRGERDPDPNNFIFKPFFSQRGRGIVPMGTEPANAHGYYQRMIPNRRYEVRVIGATWYNEPWAVYKKTPGAGMPEGQIAWNHDQGGVFRRVEDITLRVFDECIGYTRTMLNAMDLHFGAADFIVDEDRRIYFIEMNTRPGFTADYGIGYYVSMFRDLLERNESEINRPVVEDSAVEEARIENADRDLARWVSGLIARWETVHGTRYHGDVDQIIGAILSETTY
jgi:hypothetical protein